MAASHDTAQMVRGSSGWLSRVFIYGSLLFLAAVYLLPLVVMLLTSLKPLDELYSGNILALPKQWTIAAWVKAWGEA